MSNPEILETHGLGTAEPDPNRWAILAVVPRPADGGAGRFDRHDRPPLGPAGPPHLRGQPAMGDHRLHPGLRRPPAARWPDRRLRRPARMFIIGLLGFAAASALGGLAADQAMLFGARALQGAFAALMAPAALSILTITFQSDPGERAKAFGAYGAVSGAGGAIGVLAGGLLTEYASWRWCLLVNVPIALAGRRRRASGSSTRAGPTGTTRYDIPGPSCPRLGLVSLVYGFTKADPMAGLPRTTLILLAAAVVLLVAFVVVESRSPSRCSPCGWWPSATAAAPSWPRC